MPTDPSPATLCFRTAILSDVGVVREDNEDSAYARDDFLVLADGMGGHSSGEVASAIAVHTFAENAVGSPLAMTRSARTTRTILHAMSNADESLRTMGTTIVALGKFGDSFQACHIGDSRIYVLRDSELHQVTTDHTHVQHLVELGRITREQIRTHPYRAMLLKSLDDQAGGADPDLIEIDLAAGDRVLLCSDGLSDYVSERVITEILRRDDRDAVAADLIAVALRAGTRDNITVIVADVVEEPVDKNSSRFAGAAAEPISLSDDAAKALRASAPNFRGPYTTKVDEPRDPLSQTQPEPAPERGLRFAPLLFALGAVTVVAAGIFAIL